jgi:predicted acetyltransferase
MNIRYAKDEDLNDIKDIWRYCFRDEEGFFNYYFDNKYKSYNTIVVEDEKEIISSLQLNQYKISLNNEIYDTSYVVGVSTFPQGRGKGYMKNLMSYTLNELYNKNQLVSILMPIDYRLYRSYGYEHCYDQIEYNLDINDLRNFKINGNFKKLKASHIKYLIDIYSEFMSNNNGYIKRDELYYQNIFKEVQSENGYIYANVDEDGNYKGYIMYFLNDNNMFIRELFYKDMNSLKSILKFVYNHNTQVKKVIISTPLNDKIRYILPNLKSSELKIKPFMMGRIINFKGFIESLKLNYNKKSSINIKVVDDFIDENNKVFKITLDENIKVYESDENPDVNIDINTLSQLAFSYIDIDEAMFMDLVKINSYNKCEVMNSLKSIFNKKINYINEYV